MALPEKTVQQLSKMIMEEAETDIACKGCTGVTIVPIENDPNWTVSQTWNATLLCQDVIGRVAQRLQKKYRLKPL